MRTNWSLMQYHKYDLEYIDNIVAWERQIYVTLLTIHLHNENERLRLQQQTRK